MDRPGEPRKRLSAAVRREMIVDAAREVFQESGLSGARLRDIADRVGITEAYLYRYFTSKVDLYEAAVYQPVEAAVDVLDDRLNEIRASGPITAVELLRSINESILEFMVTAVPYLGVALFAEGGSTFYDNKVYPRVSEPVLALVRCIDGWPGPDVDLRLVVNSMFGLNYGIALDGLLRGSPIPIGRTAERVTRLYTVGIPQFAGRRAAAGAR
jgi:TetR/AcrR family transcriptional regulator